MLHYNGCWNDDYDSWDDDGPPRWAWLLLVIIVTGLLAAWL